MFKKNRVLRPAYLSLQTPYHYTAINIATRAVCNFACVVVREREDVQPIRERYKPFTYRGNPHKLTHSFWKPAQCSSFSRKMYKAPYCSKFRPNLVNSIGPPL